MTARRGYYNKYSYRPLLESDELKVLGPSRISDIAPPNEALLDQSIVDSTIILPHSFIVYQHRVRYSTL